MEFKDKMALHHNYGLTTSVGVYNEDSMTAQQLNIKSANKIAECLKVIKEYSDRVAVIEEVLQISYEEGNEELTLTFDKKIEDLKTQIDSSYRCIYDENAMTNLEQAGSMARAVNELVKTVNMYVEVVEEIEDFVALNYDPVTEMLTVGGEE